MKVKILFISLLLYMGFFISCGEKHISDDFVKVKGGTIQYSLDSKNYIKWIPTFCISKYEVTQELYERVMEDNPSRHKTESFRMASEPSIDDLLNGKGLDMKSTTDGEEISKRPVEYVSIYEAMSFCNILSEMEELTPVYSEDEISGKINIDNDANGYRLPSIEQWYYAACCGDLKNKNIVEDYNDYAWYDENSDDSTHEVGKKKKNKLGLFDMNGNVMEWCYSDFSSDGRIAMINGLKTEIAVAGGAYNSKIDKISNESITRLNSKVMENKYSNVGFRIMRIISWK